MLKGAANETTVAKIENIWDKVIRGYYKYLGKVFQGIDAAGGLEVKEIGEGVDSMKDDTLTQSKIADVAMAMGMPLSILLANSANYATAQVEYKTWFDNKLVPDCRFMASALNDQIFTRLGLRFEFRPEMTDPGQEDEVSRAGAYSAYINAGMLPSLAAQVVGIELPDTIEYADLDKMAADKANQTQKDKEAIAEAQSTSDTQSSTDTEPEPTAPPAKFIPNIDQLHELELWRKFAFRKLKKGEPLDFPFDVKTLPDDIARDIITGLASAKSEDDIKSVFNCDTIIDTTPSAVIDTKNDMAILELADAINKAYEQPEPIKATQQIIVDTSGQSIKSIEETNKAGKEETIAALKAMTVDIIAKQDMVANANSDGINQLILSMNLLIDKLSIAPAPVVIPAPNVIVSPPDITVQPPEVNINIPKKKPINLTVVRNNDGMVTGIQEK